MDRDNKNGTIIGNQVMIFAKHMKNDGRIISTGPNANTTLETETYEGSGSVESHNTSSNKKSWYRHWSMQLILMPLTILLVGGSLLFKFGWN